VARTLEYLAEALEEAEAALSWYAERSPTAALALSLEFDAAEAAILDRADAWPSYIQGTRRHLLRRFPFSVVYSAGPERVVIVAVAHASRRPGYWQGRVE
jgi:plasmid stabilization system protein ParE